jgi:hypothetical protein
MIRFSIIVLVLGLQYNYMTLGSGAQTIRPGQTWPVSLLHGRAILTGCFFELQLV